MQAHKAPEPFHRAGWVSEEKIDGWWIVAYKDGPRVRLLSRNHVDHAKRLRDIAAATTALPEDEAGPYRGAITRSWLKVKLPGWTEPEDRWRRARIQK